ncbi:GIY-YIG nuclease family protein [Streptococcus sciuri]|uniref:GIY-YIG nuclease family protein n=1 Tax=Streptococcus sciuri TaxID=2973939 RepID=A0ABT2F5W6_9STRE|nr:GIY-YIG nuclease family protein [Streptococcus sciuri]MCS4487868.1 GIY-YIG nuclease family protein [Streptococcus sciuri]
MARSKNINIFLMDGDVTGRMKCTLSNWTGVLYKIPRKYLKDVKDREDLKQSGIYFLLGRDDETQKEMAYIGQATTRKNGEGVLFRVLEHTRDAHADYFNDVMILTTQNNSFGSTEISYLENSFTNLAKEAGRFVVKNNNDPNPGHVTEEKQAELDEILDNTLMIIGSLGYKLFVPINQKEPVESERGQNDDLLYLKRRTKKSNKAIQATCKQTSEGFVVLKGSMIDVAEARHAISPKIIDLRLELMEKQLIKDGVLQEDQLFNSASYAVMFVLGMSANGRVEWKNKEGISLKEIEEREL